MKGDFQTLEKLRLELNFDATWRCVSNNNMHHFVQTLLEIFPDWQEKKALIVCEQLKIPDSEVVTYPSHHFGMLLRKCIYMHSFYDCLSRVAKNM